MKQFAHRPAVAFGCALLGLLLGPVHARAEMAQDSLSAGQSTVDGSPDSTQGGDLSAAAEADADLPEPAATPTPRADCGMIRTVAGDGQAGSDGDQGPAVSAELGGPMGVCLDGRGNLYIADRSNNVIREVDRGTGLIKTVAGNGTPGFSGDGGAAIYAELDEPGGVCVDGQGDLYISDTLNDRIRKVDPSGDISTLAGDGLNGYNGDGGPALSAALDAPQGICLDASGDLYFAEAANHAVRKVDLSGVITTLAGSKTSGDDGDGGPAAAAHLQTPVGVCADPQGDVYIADAGAAVVRKVDAYGAISTAAGDGMSGYQGDQGAATAAQLNRPYGVALDSSGDLYIADAGNHVVRKVDPNGVITTIAGDGTAGFDGDLGPALYAELSAPEGLAVDAQGDLYIVDLADDVVRKVTCP